MTVPQQEHGHASDDATDPLKIDRGLQAALTAGGTIALCLYWRSLQDTAHLWYDIPAGIAMCGYIAQIICEAHQQSRAPSWTARVVVMLPMAIIPVCRDFFGWPISGHLTDILGVALIQTTDSRLCIWERLAYWLPVPIIIYIRLFLFDRNGHAESVSAIIAAIGMFCLYLALEHVLTRCRIRPTQ